MRQVAAGMDTVGYSDVAVSGSNFEALATGVFERFFFFFFFHLVDVWQLTMLCEISSGAKHKFGVSSWETKLSLCYR